MNSVCMATYNGEKYLKEQLDSILLNLKPDDELIISDDRSTDSTGRILRQYRERDDRIRLLRGPGKGVIANFEHAIRAAKGDIIFLADQDDIWTHDKIAKVEKAFQKFGCSVVIHDADLIDENGRKTGDSFFCFRRSGSGAIKNIIKNSYIGCCMAFRRELLEDILPIPRRIHMHDQWIGIWGDLRYGSFFLNQKLSHYRRHGKNVSAMTHDSVLRMLCRRIVFIFECIRRMIRVKWKKKQSL